MEAANRLNGTVLTMFSTYQEPYGQFHHRCMAHHTVHNQIPTSAALIRLHMFLDRTLQDYSQENFGLHDLSLSDWLCTFFLSDELEGYIFAHRDH
jgi:hypothetical protein